MKKYIVVYMDHNGSFNKRRVESEEFFGGVGYDVAIKLNISIESIISISLDTNPVLEEPF